MKGNDIQTSGQRFPLGCREGTQIGEGDVNCICNVLIFNGSEGYADSCHTVLILFICLK